MTDKALDPTEDRDSRAELTKLGYDEADFQSKYFRQAAEETADQMHYHHHELVTVTRNYGKGTRTYSGGHGKAWAVDAIDDLKKGAFGAK